MIGASSSDAVYYDYQDIRCRSYPSSEMQSMYTTDPADIGQYKYIYVCVCVCACACVLSMNLPWLSVDKSIPS